MKRAAWVCLALGVAGVASCGKDSVTIVLLDPCTQPDCLDGEGKKVGVASLDGECPLGTTLRHPPISFRDTAAWTEIAVVRNGCPADADLALGDVTGAVFRGTRAADGSLPEIGDLEKGKYGFVALLKDENCGVIGFGCTAADLESIREVRIAVRAWTNPQEQSCTPLTGGACPAGLVCDTERGTCNPDTGSCDGGGTGCSLQLVTAGALPKAAFASSTVSGPAIVNTSCGFALGYREYSSADGTLQTTILPLSDAGALGAAATLQVVEATSACAGKSVTDGIGMAFSGSQGLLVSSLPNCGEGAGAAFVPFSDESGIKIGAWTSPRNEFFEELTLARSHSVAPATQPNEWEFIYRAVQAGVASVQRGIIQGNSFKSSVPTESPFTVAQPAFGQVATGGTARAFLGGNVAGEAGTSTLVQFSRFSATSGDTATPVGEVSLPGGSFATLAAYDDRVVAGVPGASGLTWSVYEVSTSAVTNVVDQETLGSGTVSAADVVEHNGSLIFALAKTGTITTHRFENASSSIGSTASDTGTLSGTVGGVSMSSYDGQNVAIAAGRNRVAVAWITKASATSSDPVGGYALLQCAE